MSARSRARYLAPIALIATIAGTYVIVHSALNPKAPSITPDDVARAIVFQLSQPAPASVHALVIRSREN